MSESNRVLVRYVPETVYGTTPANSTDWKEVRYTSESLTATPNTTTSAEIRADRMTADMPKVGLSVNGGINIELSGNTFDDLMASAMCSDWATDVLKVGIADSSYSIEKEFADLSQYISFTGMRVGQFSVNMAYGSIVTGSITFAGNGSATSGTSLVGTGTSTVAGTERVMNASSDVSSVNIDGVPTNICINSISLDINNNLREITCIGNDAPTDQKKGTASITGSVEMYLDADSLALYSTALANGSISLEYTVTDGTNSYTFLIPNAKLQGDAPQSGGLDQDVMFTANFTALYDVTEDTSLKITRV